MAKDKDLFNLGSDHKKGDDLFDLSRKGDDANARMAMSGGTRDDNARIDQHYHSIMGDDSKNAKLMMGGGVRDDDDEQDLVKDQLSDLESRGGESHINPTGQFGGDLVKERIDDMEKQPEEPKDHSLYNQGMKSLAKHEGKVPNRVKGFWEKHKKKIVFGGAGVGGIITLMFLFMFIASSLLIPHFLQNSLAYRFATSARSYRQANQQILSRKMSMDRMPDSRYAVWRQRYVNLANRLSDAKKLVMLERYRPKAIVNNMFATGALDFEESTKPQGIFKRTVTTAIIVNGERIPLADRRWYTPFANVQDNYRLAAEIDRALLLSNRNSTGMLGMALRTSVGSQLLQKIGVRGLFAWANRAKDYRGSTPKAAKIKLLQERYSRVKTRPGTGSVINDINKTANAASDEMDKVVREGGPAAEKLANDSVQPSSVTKIMESGLRMDLLRGVVSVASTSYALAFPACIIVETSMQRSGPAIDAQTKASQKWFMYLASAAHQEQAGATVGEAVGAVNNVINHNGEFARGNLQQIANGGNPDTVKDMQPPQGSIAGDFSILNVLLPEGAAQFANGAADSVCPTLTNVWFGLGAAAVELVAGFFTGGAYTAATKLGAAGVARAFTVYLTNFGKQILTKQFVKRYVKQAGAIGGLALLARMITEQQAGNIINGTSLGAQSTNEADAGGVALNEDMNRQMYGGRPQTAAEAMQNNLNSREELQAEQNKLAFFDRYLNINNHQSLAARTVVNVGTSINMSLIGNFLNMIGKLFNPANLASFFTTAFAPKVNALDLAGRSSYHIVPMGFSTEETNYVNTVSHYWDVTENDLRLMENVDKFNDIKEKYGRCFTDSIGTLLAEGHIVRNQDGSVKENEGLCSPNNLGRPTGERVVNGVREPTFASEDAGLVFRWRISMRSDTALTAGDEIANPGTAKAAASGSPTTGDPKALAQTLLDRLAADQIDMEPGAKRDLEIVTQQTLVNGKVTAGPTIGTCGTETLHPALLQLIVNISDNTKPKYYKLSINNFVTGHDCNGSPIPGQSGGQHPKGAAVDIQSINNGAVEDWGPDPAGGYRSQNPALATAFVTDIAALMPQGSRMGQIQCAAVKAATIPSHIQTFTDTCHHIHIDMKDVPR